MVEALDYKFAAIFEQRPNSLRSIAKCSKLKAALEQQKEIKALAATVKQQASQIQKVSAEFQLSKPALQTVVNDQ